ncbi:MAG: alcohol dehydrogenase catalytic domain-containing protein [Armatimonadota bacterium]|nr:alcohol dehydrogenase catalytic domain-containing protein [Armatimonadota bacterium]
MKAPYKVEIRNLPVREPGHDEAVVRIRACGICGTDVHIARKCAGDWSTIGHEIAGEVERVGTHVTRVRPGDKVMIENCTFCGVCSNCKNGSVEKCSSWLTLDDQPGAAEYITIREKSLHVFDDLPFEHVVLTEPLGVALDVTQLAEIPLNSNVCVMGPGPIGLMAVRIAKLKGAKNVILVGNSHSVRRLQVGREMGADEIVHADTCSVVDWFRTHFPQGVDRVIVTSPPKTLLDAVKIAGFGGIVSYIGIDFGGEELVTFDVNEVHFKRLQIRASHAVPNLMFPIAIDLLKNRIVEPEKLVSHVFPLESASEALLCAGEDKANAVKVVLSC